MDGRGKGPRKWEAKKWEILRTRNSPRTRFLFSPYKKQMREKQKSAAAAKKEKDKQDRINQKSQAEERKKKAQEKSAKGERRSGR